MIRELRSLAFCGRIAECSITRLAITAAFRPCGGCRARRKKESSKRVQGTWAAGWRLMRARKKRVEKLKKYTSYPSRSFIISSLSKNEPKRS
jgi:hypothetical protein